MKKWGGEAIENYLNFTLNLLELLNSISSSVSHLNESKILFLQAVSKVENSLSTAGQMFDKMRRRNLNLNLGEKKCLIGIPEKTDSEKENVILESLMVVKMIEIWALGLVLSGLCSDAKPYKDVRILAGGFEDPLMEGLDSRFSQLIEMQSVMKEVVEVNDAAEGIAVALSSGGGEEAIKKLKASLEAVENSVQAIEEKSNDLFCEVLGARNELLGNFRLSE